MPHRQTIVIHGCLAADQARLEAARAGRQGVFVTTIGGLAARLAGGFLRVPDGDTVAKIAGRVLRDAPTGGLGDLEPIRDLPGLQLALARTLGKAWRAGIDLASRRDEHQRFATLAAIEEAVLERLPAGMLRPADLASEARNRRHHAPAVLGPVEIRAMTALEPIWQRLVTDIAGVVPVVWAAGPRDLPNWLADASIAVETAAAHAPALETCSCATARHEITEALRWARALLASGAARAEDVAIAAASPGAFDDIVEAAAADASLPLHFAHGRRALATRDGQAAAALADLIVRGISQDRMRRLIALVPGTPALAALPENWRSALPDCAPLNTPVRWSQALSQAGDLGLAVEHVLLPVIQLIDRGPEAAEQAGDMLLTGVARMLWRRALDREAPGALERSLSDLRLPDANDPACSFLWGPASELAAAPRPFARLIGLNAQSWPRGAGEDPLLPRHLIPSEELDVLPLAEADRRDFRTIETTTQRQLVLSFARRDATGRLLGRSPLLSDGPVTYLRRARIPDHAMSEADRLMARPAEFAQTARARSAMEGWQDWLSERITSHDGLVRSGHPLLLRLLDRTHSATSLQLLLRNPLGFVWTYAFGLKTPNTEQEPFRLDPLTFGTLTHEILDTALQALEGAGGVATAAPNAVSAAVAQATGEVGNRWQATTAVPPSLMWRETLNEAAALATAALSVPLPTLDGQGTWSEVLFNTQDAPSERERPWDATQPVLIPGAALSIGGKIDRIDLDSERRRARVIDYKTGKVPKDIATRVLAGGKELQRCLYAFAVRTLLGEEVEVEAALLYPRGDQPYRPLTDPRVTLDHLAHALDLAAANLRAGLALPGPDTAGTYDDLAFALPALEGARLDSKRLEARSLLGEATAIWEAP